jgi:hypothetical protein
VPPVVLPPPFGLEMRAEPGPYHLARNEILNRAAGLRWRRFGGRIGSERRPVFPLDAGDPFAKTGELLREILHSLFLCLLL